MGSSKCQRASFPVVYGAIFLSSTLRKQERNSSGLPGWSMSSGAVSWKPSQPDCLLDAVHAGLLQEGSFPLLYLAKTALLWVASVLSLEQRKYYNTCQELNFIFKSCFLQNWIYLWPSLVTADPHMGIGVGWVTWDFFSDRYVLKNYSQGGTASFWEPLQTLRLFLVAFLPVCFYQCILTSWQVLWQRYIALLCEREGVFCCFTLECPVPLPEHQYGIVQM